MKLIINIMDKLTFLSRCICDDGISSIEIVVLSGNWMEIASESSDGWVWKAVSARRFAGFGVMVK